MKKYLGFLIFVSSLLLLGGCSGDTIYLRSPFTTAPPITLHPLEPSHIASVPAGAVIEWDDMLGEDGREIVGDKIIIEHDGYYISDYYMKNVMEAQVRE